MKIYFVYVLFNTKLKRFYIGLTINLKRRLKEHEEAKFYHRNKEFKLIYFEGFINSDDAKRREQYFKSTQGRRALRLMLRNTIQ